VWRKSLSRLSDGLNAVLPSDIRVLGVKRVTDDFHARISAVGKEYRYFIWNADIVPPFLRQYRTHVRKPLDIAAMNRAAKYLVGRRDFASFTANPKRVVESTVRHLSKLDVKRSGHEIVIIARSDGFLYKMVRSLAGHLIQVGEGTVAPSHARGILSARTRTNRVPTAPPQGLFLWSVTY
jgi:tRNA pseudouridine38-40 synthase